MLKLSKRFQELLDEGKSIESQRYRDPYDRSKERVNDNELLAWKTKAQHLLSIACGDSSQHLENFNACDNGYHLTNLDLLQEEIAVLRAAQNDYDGGYITKLSALVQAELFDSELEQATGLLNAGYKTPAAVVAGTVLETSLRELCTKAKLPHGKADKMNADLAKAGAYNSLIAKRVTALLAIRNSAAHGKSNEFNDGDVKSMIEEVQRFLAQHLS
jgi:hypothetical protein